jgi:hypothetical protein
VQDAIYFRHDGDVGGDVAAHVRREKLSMASYKMTAKGLEHQPRVPHNVAAWGAIRELFRLTGGGVQAGLVSEEEIQATLRHCLDDRGQAQEHRGYLKYAAHDNGWLERVE